MRISTSEPAVHLTYCLNIHPGEGWSDNFAAIRRHACAVRDAVGGVRPFGLGLRLSAGAAQELEDCRNLREFRGFLADQNLYVFTVNGFPFGTFHGARVKDKVYGPDWRTPDRVEYTCRLVRILGELLPEGVSGSISTVPGSYRSWCRSVEDLDLMLLNLGRAALVCARAYEETGRRIQIAIEPEPDCVWDTTDQLLELFTRRLPGAGSDLLAGHASLSRDAAWGILRNHLAVCFDTCHQAVLFEPVAGALDTLASMDIPVAKVQVSAAPSCRVTKAALHELRAFEDAVYLHQTVVRDGSGRVHRYADLGPALSSLETEGGTAGELRTHCHIPLSIGRFGTLGSTRSELGTEFFALLHNGITPHVEIETYTFSVLPEELRRVDVVDSITAEYQWFLGEWERASG